MRVTEKGLRPGREVGKRWVGVPAPTVTAPAPAADSAFALGRPSARVVIPRKSVPEAGTRVTGEIVPLPMVVMTSADRCEAAIAPRYRSAQSSAARLRTRSAFASVSLLAATLI